ncbi:MAG TPA: CAP domain-containing protein [Phycisphaerae bacterium]|nr:CAP domain-containing protein [Phycisphaerae bacterium]
MRFSSFFTCSAAAGLLIAAGCQEQSLPSLSQADSAQSTARILLADPCQDVANRQITAKDLIHAVNAERAKLKLPPLKANDTLSQTAEFYACRLIDGQFFSHVDPYDGSTVDSRAANFGYAFLKVGENLAEGQDSVEQVMSEWLESPGHRANILDPAFTEIGIAVKSGGPMGRCWVQEFGRPITAGEETHAAASDAESKPPASSSPSDHP